MDTRYLFTVSIKNGEIRIKCDEEIIGDLAMTISMLLELARTIQVKIRHARSSNIDHEDMKRRRLAFEDESRRIYGRFNDHLNKGCLGNRPAALQKIKKEFGISYTDAKIYVAEGRRLMKKIKSELGG